MLNRNDAANWRSQVAGFVEGTDSNLRSIRKDALPSSSANSALPLGGRIPSRNPESVATARVELSTLLAAVQGSLADLRVEVAAAKRLSTNASAVVAGDASPVAKAPNNRSSSVQPRTREHRATSEITPPMQLRPSVLGGSYALGQPYGPLFTSPPDSLSASPAVLLAGSISTPPASSTTGSAAPQNEELVKAIDQRLLDLGHKIERSLERSMEEQSFRAQMQQAAAVQAAAAMQQQHHMLMRSSAPSQSFTGFGNLPTTAVLEGPAVAPVAMTPSGGGATGAHGAEASPLVILAMNKADAAEKLSTEVSKELQASQKAAAKEAEDLFKRLAGLQDTSRQHFEKMCQVTSQVDSLLTQRSGAAELQAEVARVAAKLVQLETGQDRTAASIDEHQRLMRQLTMALQKLTQEAEAEHAISRSRHGETAAKLEAAASRTGEIESRVARMGDMEARMARFTDVEVRLARLGELEARTSRLPDIEARLSRLSDLEVKMARMGDVEAKLARIPELEMKVARMGDLEAKLTRLSDLELRLARMGDVEAKLVRLSSLEAKLARMEDADDVRSKHVGDLDARVTALQTSVTAITAVAGNGQVVSRTTPSTTALAMGPDSGSQEALRRLAMLEQQVARFASADPSSQVHDRRRGASPVGYPYNDSMRLSDAQAVPLMGPLHEMSGSPSHVARSSAGFDMRRSEQNGASKDIFERVKLLEETIMHSSFGQGMSSRTVQAIISRVERLEQSVRAENGIEAMAQEARLAVAEEFVIELRRDFHDVVGPTLEKLAAHVTDLRKGPGGQLQGPVDAGKMAAELRALSHRVDALDEQLAEVATLDQAAVAGGFTRGFASDTRGSDEMHQRLTMLELQVKELGSMAEDHSSIFGRLQRHQAQLDRLQHELELLRGGLASEVAELKAQVAAADGAVGRMHVGVQDVQANLEALLRLDEQLADVSGAVQSLTERLGGQEQQMSGLERQSLEQRIAAEQVVRNLSRRLGGQEDKVVVLEKRQEEQHMQQSMAEEAMQGLGERLDVQEGQVERLAEQLEKLSAEETSAVQELREQLEGQSGKVTALEAKQTEQRKAADVTFKSLTERMGGQETQVTTLKQQQQEQKAVVDAVVQGMSQRLTGNEDKVGELERQQQEQYKSATMALEDLLKRIEGQERIDSSSSVAAAMALSATGGAPGAVSRALPPGEASTALLGVVAAGAASKEALEELGGEVRTKLESVRGSIGDVRKELSGKVQVLDAQIRELLAFREEILSSYVDLQDGVERATNVADDALRKAEGLEENLQVLSEKVEKQAKAIVNIEEMKTELNELQQRVLGNAAKQQERLASLESKANALSELVHTSSQDSQAAVEARSRAEDLAYELAQVQESLESLALDSSRLAEQLVEVAAVGDKATEEIQKVTADLKSHGVSITKLQEGLQLAESRPAITTPLVVNIRGGPLPHQSTPDPGAAVTEAAEGTATLGQSPSDSEAPDVGSRMSLTLPATRSGGSQAILNPLYSASSEDNVFLGIMITESVTGVQILSGDTPAASASLGPAGTQPLTPGSTRRFRPSMEPLPPMPQPIISEEATVRDKAQFYENLASKTATEGVGAVPRRTRAMDSAVVQDSSVASAQPLCLATVEDSMAEPKDAEIMMSPGAAAATAASAVGLAGLRQAAQAAGGIRSLPTGFTGGTDAQQAASPAAGALAAVRAARSGGLSGDLSSPRMATAAGSSPLGADSDSEDAGKDGEAGVASASTPGAMLRMFGREQTFRKGVADEEVAVSSDEEDEEAQQMRRLGPLSRERTFRRGEADEEVSVSSDSGDSGEEGVHGLPGQVDDDKEALEAPTPLGYLQTTRGFDDDDDNDELAGLAPPPPASAAPELVPLISDSAERPQAVREPDSSAAKDAQAGSSSSSKSSSDSSSSSSDIDEDIEDEYNVNQPAFDDDEDISSAWPGPAANAHQTHQSGLVADGQQKAQPAVAAASGVLAAAASPSSAPYASDAGPLNSPEAAQSPAGLAAVTPKVMAEEPTGQLSTSTALSALPLAPQQLSSSAAALLSMSGELSRRRLPPLGTLPSLGTSAGGASPLGAIPSLNRSLDLSPALLRPALGSVQNSAVLGGHLSGELQASLGDVPGIRVLTPLPPLLRSGPLPAVGSPSDSQSAAQSISLPADQTAESPSVEPQRYVAAEERATEAEGSLHSFLSRPVQQPHPSDSVDYDTPMPAIPAVHTDTSGSMPYIDHPGELSEMSEASAMNAYFMASSTLAPETSMPPPVAEASGPEEAPLLPVGSGPGNRGLAALLDSDTDSFPNDHSSLAADSEAGAIPSGSGFAAIAAAAAVAATTDDSASAAPPAFPPLSSPLGDRGNVLPPLGRLGVLPPLGRPGALPPLGSPVAASPPLGLSPRSADLSEQAVSALSPLAQLRVFNPVQSPQAALAPAPVQQAKSEPESKDDEEEIEEEYDEDFQDDVESSATRGVTPAVTAAPSLASIKLPPAGDGDDSADLVVPRNHRGTLIASDSLSSLALPMSAPTTSSWVAATAPALPPLPLGVRRVAESAATPGPASMTSRASLLTSEDSLALIAPPEGVSGGLLEEGSDMEDIFAGSAEAETMDTALGAPAGGPGQPSRTVSRQSTGTRSSTASSPPRAQQRVVQPPIEQGALRDDASNTSRDLSDELFVEAERIAALLSTGQSVSRTLPGGAGDAVVSSGGVPGAQPSVIVVPSRPLPDSDELLASPRAMVPLTGLRSIYAPRPGDAGSGGQSSTSGGAGQRTSIGSGGVRSIYAGTVAAAAVVQSDPRVQGSLDFYDDEELSSSSSSSSDDDDDGSSNVDNGSSLGLGRKGGIAAAYGGAAAGGLQSRSRTLSDDSMELEVFKPPSSHAAAPAQPQGAGRVRRMSSESDTPAPSFQQQERRAVPAIPFASSLGDLSTSSGAYRIQVVTGSRTGAGCSQGAVRITLYGSEGTHVAQLRAASHSGDSSDEGELFQRSCTDDFMVDTAADLGDLSAIYIWHQGEGFGASWFLETINVEQLMTGLEWSFEVHDWVRGGQKGGRVVRLPGAKLSLSRESSLARLAGTGLGGSQPDTPRTGSIATAAGLGLGAAGSRPSASGSGSMVPQRRGLAAMGDESMDVSSDMPSPVDMGGRSARGSLNEGLQRTIIQTGRQNQDLGSAAAVASAGRIGVERSTGNTTTTTTSLHFSDGDGGDDLLPGIGAGRDGAAAAMAAAAGPPKSVFAGASVVASVAVGVATQPRLASNVPPDIGLVLEEDLEEVDGMLLTSAAISLGPVSGRSGPALVSPRPPLPPGAPRRRDSFAEDADDASADIGCNSRRQALPPTPPMNRRNSCSNTLSSGRRLSTMGLDAESSLESLIGVISAGCGSYGGRRRVRISGSGDEGGDLTSELSVEGSELSIASAASLSLYAPDGMRPPPLAGGTVGLDYLGTSRKRVSWAEYAEEFEFMRDHANSSGSVASLTEDDLLEAQGEMVRPDASSVGYDNLLRSSGSRAPTGDMTPSAELHTGVGTAHQGTSDGRGDGNGGSGGFTDVPLKQRQGKHANSYVYKIKVFTADKRSAGLGNTTVSLELLGRNATVTQELPKDRGTFQRGCVDRFTLYSTAGDMGHLLALKIWHEGKTLGLGNWGFEQLVIDDKLKGNRYIFRNPDPECVLRKGRCNCLVLKPSLSRIDESEDLAEVAREFETQLSANRELSELERAGLRGKLEKINQRLSKLGTKLARSLSDSFKFP